MTNISKTILELNELLDKIEPSTYQKLREQVKNESKVPGKLTLNKLATLFNELEPKEQVRNNIFGQIKKV